MPRTKLLWVNFMSYFKKCLLEDFMWVSWKVRMESIMA